MKGEKCGELGEMLDLSRFTISADRKWATCAACGVTYENIGMSHWYDLLLHQGLNKPKEAGDV